MSIMRVIGSAHRVAVGFGVAGFAALNAAAFVGGYFNECLDLVAHLTPALLVVGLAVSVLAAIAWGIRGAGIALVLAASPPALAMAVESLSGLRLATPVLGAEIKVLSFNMWSGNGSVGAAEGLIRREQPDLILLQEASTKRHRDLLRRLSATYPYQVNSSVHCATRVLSKFQLIEAFEWPDCALAGGRFRLPPELGGEISAISVHLPRPYLPDSSRQSEAALRRIVESSGGSLIVGGDFNRAPWSRALRRFDNVRRFSRRTRGMATWPTPRQSPLGRYSMPWPVLPIDHVYATADWQTASARTGPDVGSDHLPVIVALARSVDAAPR